jgi:cytochrome c-type biogenesis protein CcmF
MMVVGIVGTTAYRQEHILLMKPGEKMQAAGYEVTFVSATQGRGPNYREELATFSVSSNGAFVKELVPSKRIYDMPPQPTTEAGIYNAWGGDLYIVIGDEQLKDGAYALRVYFNPLVRCIWIGALIMFIGGGISLADRRLRLGVPVKARKVKEVAA